jgi:subtilisin family serine protease
MNFKSIYSTAFLGIALTVLSQQKAPENWFNLDYSINKVNGVSTERAYTELLKNKTSKTVIVGVIDSGVDFEHEDLKDVMWTNTKEIPGNGIDDDKNGYIDDIHGWNFLGGKDGKNVDQETIELTRLLRVYKKRFGEKTESEISAADKNDFKFYQEIKTAYETEMNEAQQNNMQISFIQQMLEGINKKAKEQLKLEKITAKDLENFKAEDARQKQMLGPVTAMLAGASDLDALLEQIKEGADYYGNKIKYNLNLEFDPRTIIGDDYANQTERFYGNADCNGPNSLHGTHVAGIIAANRKNNIGIKGVADNVQIMAIRAVPDGDEHDKDVANAIYYAVDNGASVINMSFGKKYSYNKKVVDEAIKYAESKDVLIVHAAGNESLNIDKITHYPCKKFENSNTEASNFIDVGALNWRDSAYVPASFSNYGKKTVDVFAPGVDIYSAKNGGGYINESGTSMASPVTAGVAAVLRSYYPFLTATQVKDIIKKSVDKRYKKKKIILPGDKEEKAKKKFSILSQTGGIVNLYNAVMLAEKLDKKNYFIKKK